MNHVFTLILILHNRHKNMRRLLDYYNGENFPILIADSSASPFAGNLQKNVKHIYTPGYSFTQKIEHVLRLAETPYVVMCADDDFIVPSAIDECCIFLSQNSAYSTAQGRCIKYLRSSVEKKKVRFGLLYEHLVSVEDNLPTVRIEKMFADYRSLLYAVHRTEVLRKCFEGAGASVSNLYLNEYLTAVVPLVAGKTKELDCLYQIREYAEDSDDKLTDNLDVIIKNEHYKSEFENFLQLQTVNCTSYVNFDEHKLYATIKSGFIVLADKLKIYRNIKPTLKKRVGLLLQKIPFLGESVIETNRRKENQKDMDIIIQQTNDKVILQKVEEILLKHSVIS
jgi:glycosyltransferase domain-containing protein